MIEADREDYSQAKLDHDLMVSVATLMAGKRREETGGLTGIQDKMGTGTPLLYVHTRKDSGK